MMLTTVSKETKRLSKLKGIQNLVKRKKVTSVDSTFSECKDEGDSERTVLGEEGWNVKWSFFKNVTEVCSYCKRKEPCDE